MTDAHDEHSQHDHGGHDEHGSHDHDFGNEHAEHWGDYNSRPPAPSTLPAVGPGSLIVMGLTLAALFIALLSASFRLATARPNVPHTSAEHGKTHAERE